MWLLKIGDPLIEVTTHAGLTVFVAAPVNSNYQTVDDKMFICKFSKNVKSKIYHTENSKTRGQTV